MIRQSQVALSGINHPTGKNFKLGEIIVVKEKQGVSQNGRSEEKKLKKKKIKKKK